MILLRWFEMILQADIKEQSSPGKSVSENSDLVVELEKVKKKMKSMETTLLGAARQAQEQQTPMSLITAHFQVINEASSSSTSSPAASIVQRNLPSSPSIWSDYLVGD
uniref:Golgin candidate 5 n=1 Tax=Tanacetum cinerariifolium TaxID=118510 RepID=A0A699L321_TANCI|nr:golgin candidate 5 [Tanacetum cinerariifolium]